jgi:F-type H+-transporting ATPase subunit c
MVNLAKINNKNINIRSKLMGRKIFVFCVFMILVLTSAVMANETVAVATGYTDWTKLIFIAVSILGAGLCMGTVGTGLGMGNAIAGASEAVGRNPQSHGKIMMTMMIGLAMVESVAIYALVISLIILYANPFKAVVLG